jgi:hypothetical protein
MKLLCSTCFNYTFFEADVEYLRELAVKNGSLVVSDSHFDECNFTDTHFRDSLEDIVNYVLKSDTDALKWDPVSKRHLNRYITCARCSSKEVTIPYCKYNYHKHQSLEDELKSNQENFKQFRRERHGDTLPQLWKPK